MTPELRQVVLWLSILKYLDDLGCHTWTSHVKALLFKFGFVFVWVSQDICDIHVNLFFTI